MRLGAMLSQTGSPQGLLLTRFLVTGECLLVTPAPSPSRPPIATAAPAIPSLSQAGAPACAFTGSCEQPAPGRGPHYLKPYQLIQGSWDCYEYFRAEFKDRIMLCTCKYHLIQVGTILLVFVLWEISELSSAVISGDFGLDGIRKIFPLGLVFFSDFTRDKHLGSYYLVLQY